MAPLKVRKPTAIMFDIVATATKSFFIDQVLFPYIKKNSKAYLAANWENSVIQHDVMLLREAAKKDKSSVKIADASADADTIQRSVCEYVSKALDELKDNEALTQFRFHILFDGYANGHIETPVYTDVAIQIHNWAVDEKIKLYVFSNGWKEATKRYLQKTNHGDMNLLIEDHFDTEDGPLTDSATFKKVVSKVKQAPEDILFLTHNGKEGYAAKKAGLSVILIMTHRRDVAKLSEQEKKDLPYVRSFNEIIFSGDAPKASELDGSSVVDDEAKSSSAKSKSTKSSSKKSNKSAASTSESKKGPKSAESGHKKGSSSSAKSSSQKAKSADASGSKSTSNGGLSVTFSGATSKSSKKSTTKSGSKKSAEGGKSGAKPKSTSGPSSKGGSKSSLATTKTGTGSASSSTAVTVTTGSKSASQQTSGSSTAGSSKSKTAGSKASGTGGGNSKSAASGSKAGSKTSGAGGSKSSGGGSSPAGGTAASGSKSSGASGSTKSGSK